jgi:hypothetical protein
MPSLLLHLAAVERLAADPQNLPAEFARALHEDIEYARFGAALADLPSYDGLRGGADMFQAEKVPAPFAQLFHSRAPVAMGLKMTELVSNGALVGSEAGLAFIAGYFSHVALDRTLAPVLAKLTARHRRQRETQRSAQRRIEWLQALFYLREQRGRDLIGTSGIRPLFQLAKRLGPPTRGVGRGLYELVRLSAQETLDQAPRKGEVDSWVRGLYLFSLLLSSPLGNAWGLPSDSSMLFHDYYRSADLDLAVEVDSSLQLTRTLLERLSRMIGRGTFTKRRREQFLAEFSDRGLDACAA